MRRRLLTALQTHYSISIDWKGSDFCGHHLAWNYPERFVNITMPNYIPNLLDKLQYSPKRPQYSPYPMAPFTPARLGDSQYAPEPDLSPPLNPKDTTLVQSIVGLLLYHARAIDCTILPALNTLGTQQVAPTSNTLKLCHRLLNYVATYPNVIIRFHASDMILYESTQMLLIL